MNVWKTKEFIFTLFYLVLFCYCFDPIDSIDVYNVSQFRLQLLQNISNFTSYKPLRQVFLWIEVKKLPSVEHKVTYTDHVYLDIVLFCCLMICLISWYLSIPTEPRYVYPCYYISIPKDQFESNFTNPEQVIKGTTRTIRGLYQSILFFSDDQIHVPKQSTTLRSTPTNLYRRRQYILSQQCWH